MGCFSLNTLNSMRRFVDNVTKKKVCHQISNLLCILEWASMNDDIHVSCKLNNKSNCLFGDVFFEVFKEKNSNKFVHYWKFVTNRDVESWNPLHQKCKLWITYPRLLSLFIFLWNIFLLIQLRKTSIKQDLYQKW